MDPIEKHIYSNQFYEAFLEIDKLFKNASTFYFSKYLQLLTSLEKTPQLKAFLNMIRNIPNNKLHFYSLDYHCDFFFIENLYDLNDRFICKNLLTHFFDKWYLDNFNKLLNVIGSKFEYTFYESLLTQLTQYEENYYEVPYYIKKSNNIILFRFISKVIDTLKAHFTFDEVKICVKAINLCNIVAKSSNLHFLKKINQYLDEIDWATEDTFDFIPLLDAAKYSNIHVFNYVYDKTPASCKNWKNEYSQNILDLSLLNNDTRILKKLLIEGYEFNEFYIVSLLYSSKKYITKLNLIIKNRPYLILNLTQKVLYSLKTAYSKNVLLKLHNNLRFDFDFSYDLRINVSLLNDEEVRELLFEKITNKELFAQCCFLNLNFDNPFLKKFDIDTFIDKKVIIQNIISKIQINNCEEYIKEAVIYVKSLIDRYKIKDAKLIKNQYGTTFVFYDLIYRYGLYNFIDESTFTIPINLNSEYNKHYFIIINWRKTIRFFHKKFAIKQKSLLKKHEIKFNRILYEIHKPPTKIKKEYPKHIEACDIVKLCQSSQQIFISPKADGERSNINNFDMYPKISSLYFNDNFDCELMNINGTKVHFIISDMDTINELIKKHYYFPKKISDNFEHITEDELVKEKEALERYTKKHIDKDGLWWPKRVYKISHLNYDKLLSDFYKVYPTDGWIIYADKTYKLKPLRHLTIDLRFNNNQFFSKESTLFKEDIEFIPTLENNMIYRLLKKDKWVVQGKRLDKKTANPNYVINLIVNQHINPINYNKIISVFENTKLYYQHFTKIEKTRRDTFISKYSKSNRVIDIGCGFKCNKNSKTMNSKYYLGIDIDSKIDYSHFILLNLQKNWNEQLKLLNNQIQWGSFDNILMINSIQNIYKNQDDCVSNINNLARKGCIMIIKFLDWDLIKLLNKEIIKQQTNFVRITEHKKIKYYYSNVHIKPIEEHVYSGDDIKLMFKSWKVIFDTVKQNKAENDWDKYKQCFRYICLQF